MLEGSLGSPNPLAFELPVPGFQRVGACLLGDALPKPVLTLPPCSGVDISTVKGNRC